MTTKIAAILTVATLKKVKDLKVLRILAGILGMRTVVGSGGSVFFTASQMHLRHVANVCRHQ